MSWDSAIGELKDKLPKFNDYLLRGYRQDQVDRFPDFMDVVFKEAVRLFEGKLQYLGYRTLNPKEIIDYISGNRLIKGSINIQRSELQLVEYIFQYEDRQIAVQLYLPYLFQGALMINDTRYYLQLPIIERTIFRVTDGVIIKVMRSPLQFWRSEQFMYKTTKGETYFDAIITIKAHYRKDKTVSTKVKTPLVLYLLAKYPFDEVVHKILGLPAGSVTFVEQEDPNDTQYAYFQCRGNIYLKVHKELVLNDLSFRRFVASLLYILKMTKRCTINDVYNTTFYKMILGKNLYGQNTKEALAAGHAESHLDSLKTYLDAFTKEELRNMHIYCNDVFDLFVAVFFNIDTWLMSYSPNDLFNKRIGGADLILMDMVKTIFQRFYNTLTRNKRLEVTNIEKMLRIDPMKISVIHKVKSLRPNNDLYNDNTLTSVLVKRLRQSSSQEGSDAGKRSVNLIGAKEHHFHPSFVAIESVLAISSSSPGISGDINPFACIDTNGYFHPESMPWYEEIRPLSKYLVNV